MKAVRLHAYGSPAVIEDIPDPIVSDPWDVIVRVGGAGLCRTDLHVLDGVFADLSLPPPYVMGHETAGWIHAIGSAVEGLKSGDPVIVHPFLTCGTCPQCRRGADNRCDRFRFFGAMVDGGFAELMATSSRSVVRLDSRTAPREVAGLADGGLTAYRAVKHSLPWLVPGSLVAIIGAGGLGHIAVQLLRAMTTARVVAVDRSVSALELATQLGAHVAVEADGGQVQGVLDATDGRGADVVLDFVGDGGTPADAIRMTAKSGRCVIVGYGGRLEVPAYDLVEKEITVVGSLVGTRVELAELAILAQRGLVRVVTREYPLAAAREAMDDLRAGRILGRAVLIP